MKFTRVDLEDVLRADCDGMPVFRECFEHETLMSFYDDAGNYAFQEWWNEAGSELFAEWCSNHPDYVWLLNA